MPDPVDIYVGQKMREARLLAGLTQSEIAAVIRVKFQQVQKYETASNRISASRLWAFADHLGLPLESLFPLPGNKR